MELLDRFLPPDRSEPEFLQKSEEPALQARVVELFRRRIPVRLNQHTSRWEFVSWNIQRADDVGQPHATLMRDGFLEIDLRAVPLHSSDAETIPPVPSGTAPHVTLTWNLFAADGVNPEEDAGTTQRAREEMVAMIRIEDGPQRLVVFRRGKDSQTWTANASRAMNPLAQHGELLQVRPDSRRSIAGLLALTFLIGCIATWKSRRSFLRRLGLSLLCLLLTIALAFYAWTLRPRPAHAQLQPMMQKLLDEIYGAFDYEQESDMFDQLAQCISGPMLESAYNEFYKNLLVRKVDDKLMKVYRCDVEFCEALAPARLQCRWMIDGYIGHLSHLHKKIIEHEAVVALAPESGKWKIADLRILSQKVRLDETRRWK